MPSEPSRGELHWVDWSPSRGSEQAGRRPALVVQTNAANHNPRYPNTIVVTVSTRGRTVPTHVRVEPSAENGLKERSFVKCEQILTISKSRLDGRLGRLEESLMREVDAALRLALSI